MLGENTSPLKSTNGLRCCNDFTAVLNLSAPPIGSVSKKKTKWRPNRIPKLPWYYVFNLWRDLSISSCWCCASQLREHNRRWAAHPPSKTDYGLGLVYSYYVIIVIVRWLLQNSYYGLWTLLCVTMFYGYMNAKRIALLNTRLIAAKACICWVFLRLWADIIINMTIVDLSRRKNSKKVLLIMFEYPCMLEKI